MFFLDVCRLIYYHFFQISATNNLLSQGVSHTVNLPVSNISSTSGSYYSTVCNRNFSSSLQFKTVYQTGYPFRDASSLLPSFYSCQNTSHFRLQTNLATKYSKYHIKQHNSYHYIIFCSATLENGAHFPIFEEPSGDRKH